MILATLQVQIGSHSFTFDHVFGSTGTPLPSLFERCVAPLVDGLFHGYNATVLAYGQVLDLVTHFRVCSDETIIANYTLMSNIRKP